MRNEQEDRLLICSDPGRLLVNYQEVIEIIVARYAAAGYFHYTECEEVVAVINERMLMRMGKITELYNGSVKVVTYMSAIIRNIINEYLRSVKYNSIEQSFDSFEKMPTIRPVEVANLAIYEELRRFSTVLKLFGRKQTKVELCLKIFFRLNIDVADFFSYARKAKNMLTKDFIDYLNSSDEPPLREIFNYVTPWFNAVEGKKNNAEALRRWIKARINEIIDLMNGDPPQSAYTKETIGILAERYFSQDTDFQSKNNK